MINRQIKSIVIILIIIIIIKYITKIENYENYENFKSNVFISPNIVGGLGNQMFIIAAAYSYSLDHDIPMISNKIESVASYGKPRPTYWGTLFHKVNVQKITQSLDNINDTDLPNKIKISKPTFLNGYCQNTKFFHHNRNAILELFTLPDELEKKVNTIYDNIVKQFNENTVSVHVRGEDNSTANDLSLYREIMPIEFFINAMDQCGKDSTFVILSNNIQFCKKYFKKYKNIYYSNNEDYIDIKLISKCRSHIIPASTFSWWGVYLNPNQNKRIYFPNPHTLPISKDKKNFIINYKKTLLSSFKNLVLVNFDNKSIPKIIHQTWKTKDLPNNFEKWRKSCIDLHSNWEFKLWDDIDNRNFIKNNYNWFLETYDNYDINIKRVDAVRYFYIYHYGGVYMDMDFACLKNIEPILKPRKAIFGYQVYDIKNVNSIANAFMSAYPKHPLFLKLIKGLKYAAKKYNNVIYATGPGYLSKKIMEYKRKNKLNDIIVYKMPLIYTYEWDQKHNECDIIEDCKKKYPNSYTTTYWTATWVNT